MGWKALVKHFNIDAQVAIWENTLVIGTGYVSDLATLDLTNGRLSENSTFPGFIEKNAPDLLKASPEERLAQWQKPDQFTQNITVYTYSDDGEILEKLCEVEGYPNLTHDGCLMYVNRFSSDLDQVVEWARSNANARVEMAERDVASCESKLTAYQAELAAGKEAQSRFNKRYPAKQST